MNTLPPDPFDRALAAYSARERGRAIDPPAGFADRVTAAVMNRPRWLWKAVSAAGTAVLMAVLATGYAAWPKPQPAPQADPPVRAGVEPDGPTPNIGDTLSEAGSALAKLTRTTAEKATPRTLLPAEPVKVPDPKPVRRDVQPATEAIAAMPAAARSGLGPMSGSTRRAINAFLRDTGLRAD
jgi:hypothetical protein